MGNLTIVSDRNLKYVSHLKDVKFWTESRELARIFTVFFLFGKELSV